MGRHTGDRPGKPPLHADLLMPAAGARGARERVTFESLLEPHREALETFALRLTGGDETTARSVLKETYYRAAQEPLRVPPGPAAVRPWLVLTARRVLRDSQRMAGHDDRPLVVPDPEPARLPTVMIVRALEELPLSHRDILVEVFYRGVSLQDAADAWGMPAETLKTRLYLALRSLRVTLGQQATDPAGPPPPHRAVP